MKKTTPDSKNSFDIAELAQNIAGEEPPVNASHFSEKELKSGLFLVSKTSNNRDIVGDTRKVSKQKKTKCTTNRKRVIFDETFLLNGKSYRVNSTKSGLYVEILTSMINQFEIALSLWKRVFVLRFDLHTHIWSKNNKIITSFRKRLFQKLKRNYGFKDIGFCWVREQERAKAQHYHFVIFLDGRLIRHSSKINKIIKNSWEDPAGDFTVPCINRPYYFVDSEDIAQEAVYRVSYLAKPRGKGYRPPQTKDYSCSRIVLSLHDDLQ